MSNTDSFIDEVNEEVRNDRLYAIFRKYAWVGVLVILAIVGGAVGSEYVKSSREAAAAAAGDALATAFEAGSSSESAAALGAVADAHPNAAFIAELARANALAQSGQVEEAQKSLEAAKLAAPQTPTFQDLIVLKTVLLPGSDMPAAEKISLIEPATAVGRPYRLVALEQLGYAQVSAGDVEAALSTFITVVQDANVSEGVQGRAQQMIVALGGELPE